MNRMLMVLILLMPTSTNVLAEKWIAVSKEDRYTIYIDTDSLHKGGKGTKAWTLWDYKDAQEIAGVGFSSMKQLNEFNCNAPSLTIRHMESYSGHMGKGHTVRTFATPESWEPVFPETVAARVYYLATSICKI